MTIRDRLVDVTSKAKTVGIVDLALRYNPAVRREVRNAIAEFRQADLQQRRQIATRLAGAIVLRGRQTHYGRHYGTDLALWPVLSKERVRANSLDFVIPGLLRVPAATGGTTGLPLRLQRSLRSVAAEQVFLDDMLASRGLSWASARIAVLRGDKIKDIRESQPPFGKESHWGRRLILSSPHLNAENLDWYLDRLATFKPDILCGWANMMANLLMLLARAERHLRIPLVLTSSSLLDTPLYRAIGQELGATIIDYYGLAERSALAIRTREETWYFEPAYGNVELLPSADDPVAGGRRDVRIVATGYWNDAQPLIRYDTGDRAIVPAGLGPAELEAIALGLRPFYGVAGRENEFILAPDGRRISGLSMISYEVGNVLQVQLVQQALNQTTIRVLTTPGFGPADRDQLIANARNKIPYEIALDVEVVDRLEASERGKTPYIIRRVNVVGREAPEAGLRAAE
jgi:phenylacetate-CoA ligase